MEACATAHHWARELTKLGHEVRLTAKDVKAYVKRNKNDAADAEATCEAVRRKNLRRRSFIVTLRKPLRTLVLRLRVRGGHRRCRLRRHQHVALAVKLH